MTESGSVAARHTRSFSSHASCRGAVLLIGGEELTN